MNRIMALLKKLKWFLPVIPMVLIIASVYHVVFSDQPERLENLNVRALCSIFGGSLVIAFIIDLLLKRLADKKSHSEASTIILRFFVIAAVFTGAGFWMARFAPLRTDYLICFGILTAASYLGISRLIHIVFDRDVWRRLDALLFGEDRYDDDDYFDNY